MAEVTNSTQASIRKHSVLTYLSFAFLIFGINGMQIAVLQNYTIFYQVQVGLDIGLMFLAGIVYTVWDMFNDPFIGHISDRNNRFTRRWGKRFPWLVIGTIGLLFAVVLLFLSPTVSIAGSLFTFLWFLVFLSVYDGILSAILVNYKALVPNKFKSKEERTLISTFIQFFMILGPFIGLIIAPILLRISYVAMALFLAGFVFVSYVLSLPGLREDEELKEVYFREEVHPTPFFSEFISNIKQSFRERSFVVLAIVTVCITVASTLVNTSIPYYIVYNLEWEREMQAIINMPFVLMSVLPIPIFFWLIKKFGHAKAFKYSLLLLPIPLLMMFISFGDFMVVLIGAGIYGFIGGIMVIAQIPVQADFFDESAVKYHKRQEGVYLGIWNFFGRLNTAIQLGILFMIQSFFGFNAGATTQTVLAKWGIMIHFTLIPAIFLFIGAIVFLKYWYLTPDKIKPIKDELERLGL
ncbi:MAG: MFS transporter [Candidatus Hermodarchaeota archaeon]